MFFHKLIHVAVLAAALLSCAAVVLAQSSECIVSGANPTQLRSGGIAERAGDVLITCVGGTPTPAGLPVPTGTIKVTFNTNVTSRVLAPFWSEALLLIDEPVPAIQRVCGTPGDTVNALGSCTIIGTGDPATVYDGSPGRPNIFQGIVAGPNTLVWPNVPLDPPGQTNFGSLILRVVNIRADAAAFGPVAIDQPPVPVTATLATSGTFPGPIKNNPQQFLSQVQNGFSPSAATPAQCAPEAATLSQMLGKQVSQVNVQASKGFGFAFRPRIAASFINDNTSPPPVDQNVPGTIYLSETGFFNRSFPKLPPHGALARAGVASQGTRIAIRIANAPAGVSLYASVVIHTGVPCNGISSTGVARRIDTNANGGGPFLPTPADAAGMAALVEQGGTLTTVYEVLAACTDDAAEQFDFPIFADAPSLGGATALVGLAPFAGEPKMGDAGIAALLDPPEPRFVIPAEPGLALAPLACE